jgi:hypothetical protein
MDPNYQPPSTSGPAPIYPSRVRDCFNLLIRDNIVNLGLDVISFAPGLSAAAQLLIGTIDALESSLGPNKDATGVLIDVIGAQITMVEASLLNGSALARVMPGFSQWFNLLTTAADFYQAWRQFDECVYPTP